METATRVPRLLTIREAAERSGLEPKFLYAIAGRGELPSYKCGRSRRIAEGDLAHYLESCRRASA
jgi:excisionase family DNA binding protein